MIFPAKVDLWFLALFYGLGIFMLLGAPWIRNKPRGRFGALLLGLIGLLFVGIGWRASSVTYRITEDGFLDATGWPLAGRITHASEITQIAPSRDPRSSHAASLDRLRIDYGEGGLIFIAVQDKSGFLDAIAAKDPALIRSEMRVVRARSGEDSVPRTSQRN